MLLPVAAIALQDTFQRRHYVVRPQDMPPPYSNTSKLALPSVHPPAGTTYLKAPPGFKVSLFASGLQSPRWLCPLPNGDVLCAECYQGRIRLLRDSDGDGRAETKTAFATGLDLPFGMALQGGWLYVANTNGVVRFRYDSGATRAGEKEVVVTGIPSKGYRQHWTRDLLFEPDGRHFFFTVGSETNKSPEPPPRAMVLRYSADGKQREVWATGLRNAVGLVFRPGTQELWCTAVERDYMGDDVVPDFAARLHKGDFFGWPWWYVGRHRDPRVPLRDAPDKPVKVPDILFQAHSVPLGVVFYNASMFPPEYRGDMFVAMRGSTNRRVRSGYIVARVHFANGKPTPGYDEFVQGWIPDRHKGLVYGRPVGLAVWKDGSLLIADEGGNRVWRVSYGQ